MYISNKTVILIIGTILLICSDIMAIITPKDSIPSTRELAPVTIYSSRVPTKDNQLPVAVSVIGKDRLQVGQTKMSLFESLTAVPGVFAMNSENFAQDLRISIRGFGARAAFGIRGLKIVMDGIPESTPDGTAKLGNMDVGMVERVEVIKGATAGIYGNASGGVISLISEYIPEKPFAEFSTTLGAWGLARYQVKTGGTTGKFSYLANASRLQSTGYRDKSTLERNLINLKLGYQFTENAKLTFLAGYVDSPKAEDPGGLTLEEVGNNRRQARKANIDYNTTETFKQVRLAMVYDQNIGKNQQLNIRSFYVNRDFNTNQGFENSGQIAFKREFWGGGVAYQWTLRRYRLKTGVDLENQSDNRQRYDNKLGLRGTLRLDQLEDFRNVGLYILQEFTPTKHIRVAFNTRYDWVNLEVKDAFLSDGNQSATKNFKRFSPMLGISYNFNNRNTIYSNFTSNFETPSLNELTNNPTGQGGFNPDLAPQKSQNYELGYKAWLGTKIRVDLAVFKVKVQDEIVPYQLPNQVGRTFYRNAGLSTRNGLELGITYKMLPALTGYFNYTYSDFKYQSYQTLAGKYDGNALPGIPNHNVYSELRYFPKTGFFAIAQFRSISSISANDANTVKVDGYALVNLRLGWQKQLKGILIEPFIGVNNINNAVYFANIQINATANRYYEPASGRFFFGGLKVRI
jgi:iron complex outermembrane receptor protein